MSQQVSQQVSQKVDVWFDPVCPFAWITSRWVLEAAKLRDIEPTWKIMSLAYLNKDREMDAAHTAGYVQSRRLVRLVASVGQKHGNDAVLALYNALGERIHNNKQKYGTTLATEALAAAGLPAELIADLDNEAMDEIVFTSHNQAMSMVGNDVGTPVIAIGDAAFFGPVISPGPKGEAAADLWDGFVLCVKTPGFFELKRARSGGPDFS